MFLWFSTSRIWSHPKWSLYEARKINNPCSLWVSFGNNHTRDIAGSWNSRSCLQCNFQSHVLSLTHLVQKMLDTTWSQTCPRSLCFPPYSWFVFSAQRVFSTPARPIPCTVLLDMVSKQKVMKVVNNGDSVCADGQSLVVEVSSLNLEMAALSSAHLTFPLWSMLMSQNPQRNNWTMTRSEITQQPKRFTGSSTHLAVCVLIVHHCIRVPVLIFKLPNKWKSVTFFGYFEYCHQRLLWRPVLAFGQYFGLFGPVLWLLEVQVIGRWLYFYGSKRLLIPTTS